MVVADITVWILFLAVFNYGVVYRRNKLFGSIGYLAIGFILFGITSESSYTGTMYPAIAFFMMAGALMNLIYVVVGAMTDAKTKAMSEM